MPLSSLNPCRIGPVLFIAECNFLTHSLELQQFLLRRKHERMQTSHYLINCSQADIALVRVKCSGHFCHLLT